MTDRLAMLEARVDSLAREVERLAARLLALEAEPSAPAPAPRRPESAAPPEGAPESSSAPPSPPAEGVPAGHAADAGEAWGPVALLGRTLMVLGGAYLFRALTEAGTVPAAGVAMGLGYALVWLALADRAAAVGRRLSACFHGAAFALIGAPLAWEASHRFEVLSVAGGAAVLAAVTGAALAVAWRRDLRPVAWVASAAGILAAWALMGSPGPVLPAALALLLVGVASEWAARPRGWTLLPWVSAGAVDLTLAALLLRELGRRGRPAVAGAGEAGSGLAALLLACFVLYAGSAVLRAARRSWRPSRFDRFQLPAAIAVGYGGALLLVVGSGTAATVVGLGSAAAGGAALAALRALFAQRAARRSAYVLAGALALVLVLGSTELLLPHGLRAPVWALLAVATAWLASRAGSVTLALHAAVYATAAAAASGLLAHGSHALAASGDTAWPRLGVAELGILAALAVAASASLPRASPFWRGIAGRIPKVILLAVVAWSGFGALCSAITPWVAGPPGPDGADPSTLALLRTAVIAAAALTLAWLARFRRFREAAWLVYPVLVAGAFKLILEDFLLGRPGELFGALGLYGAVLILAPRMVRAGRATSRSATWRQQP